MTKLQLCGVRALAHIKPLTVVVLHARLAVRARVDVRLAACLPTRFAAFTRRGAPSAPSSGVVVVRLQFSGSGDSDGAGAGQEQDPIEQVLPSVHRSPSP